MSTSGRAYQQAEQEKESLKKKSKIQSFEDKCNHLNKLKVRLKRSLNEVEDSWKREKKHKGDIEKQKRQVEGNLKLTQETVSDLEGNKLEMGQVLQRKEKESSYLSEILEMSKHLLESLALRSKNFKHDLKN